VKFLLLFAFLFAPQDQPQYRAQEKPPENCTLSGTVVNAVTGEPLTKVRVLGEGGEGESGAVPSTTTDAKGRFTLVQIPPGRYQIKGERNGYIDGAYGARRADGNGTPITLEPGQEIKDLVLKLTPFGVIAGTIRDSDGEPLARIAVLVHRLKFDRGRRRMVEAGGTFTDDLGQYRIPDLPPGQYYVWADSKKRRDVGAGFGTDLGASIMEEESADHSSKDAPPPQVLLPTMYPGVQDPTAARPVEVGPGSRITGVDIALVRSATVSVRGRVTVPAGMGVRSLFLDYPNAENESQALRRFATPNEKGEFEFRAVPPGSYILTASAGPQVKPFSGTIEMFQQDFKTRVPLQVGTSPVSGVRVEVAAGAIVQGHIAIAGKDPPKEDQPKLAGRFLMFDDGQSEPVTAMVTEANSFKSPLPPGHYIVLTSTLGGGDLVVRSIQAQGRNILDEGLTVSNSGQVEMEIVLAHDAGQLEGVALGADDKPVAGATVILAPEPNLRSRFDLFEQVETDQYGRFTIDSIAPGDYKLFAWDDVEPGIWADPAFLKKYESQGEAVTIAVKGTATVKVHLAKD
jgi:protocatechuate 3,4-dioxygenase beta subunit